MSSESQFSPMVLIGEEEAARILRPVRLEASKSAPAYDEAWLQRLLFAHPEAIPVEEIDSSFGPLAPVCMELGLGQAGYVDALYANHLGLLTVAEFKLWRNPEARREVVGQILDYARVLRRWSYADLKREVSRVLKAPGENSLYDLVRRRHLELDEARFIDNVSRNPRQGRFLLLIIGDGIREGVESISNYLQDHAGVHFTFGLVETSVYELGNGRRLVQPRILARSLIVNRSIVDLKSEQLRMVEPETESDSDSQIERSEAEVYYESFWAELLKTIKLDDVNQPLPRPIKQGNIFFFLQPSSMWITAFFHQRNRVIGVFLGWDRTSTAAQEICARLTSEREVIDRELGIPIEWYHDKSGKLSIVAKISYAELLDPQNRNAQLAWFRDVINRFVSVFRPRIASIWRELSANAA